MRIFLPLLLPLLFLLACQSQSAPLASTDEPPNIIVIFADDLGYGDLGVYGHPTLATPNLDRMAQEGMKFTQFYVGASVCTPSRAALMTGRLPIRSGMAGQRRVLFPNSSGGLPASEITIAEGLKTKGYATACIGKWHLGHLPQFLPPNQGFDYYFGIPYSNDMSPAQNSGKGAQAYPPLPLMENLETIEEEPGQGSLTRRYTEKAVNFIRENQEGPFFLYYPHTFPHIPLYASEEFKDKSRRGLYGDVVEEIDWSVGEILKTVQELGLAENTLVFFTSDNGPWLAFKQEGGSAGLLRDGKGATWEGGMREPAIAWWPGTVPAGRTTAAVATTMDLLPTAFRLAGVELPQDRVLDGQNMLPVLKGEVDQLHDEVVYYLRREMYAYRKGPWKAHFTTLTAYAGQQPEVHDPPLLFHLEHDPSEKYDLAAEHPEVIAEIKAAMEAHRATVVEMPDHLAGKIGEEE